MNKSLLALAVLGAFAGAASAQSSVTIYGKIELAAGKPTGTTDKQIMDNNTGSRIGFRGVEDLGGGMQALFGFEHRLSPDTGASTSTNFWNGFSTVGLAGSFGRVNLGRQYVAAFTHIQNQIDPFSGDTQAALRDTGMRFGGITKVRVADSIRYDFSAKGINFAASVGEAPAGSPDRPMSVAVNYSAGPMFLGLGIENPEGANDNVWNIGGRYNFGFATLSAGYGKGSNNANVDAKGFLLGAVVPFGATDFKIGYAENKLDNTSLKTKRASIGADYNLSKRTKLFANYSKVGGGVPVGPKSGYSAGINHSF